MAKGKLTKFNNDMEKMEHVSNQAKELKKFIKEEVIIKKGKNKDKKGVIVSVIPDGFRVKFLIQMNNRDADDLWGREVLGLKGFKFCNPALAPKTTKVLSGVKKAKKELNTLIKELRTAVKEAIKSKKEGKATGLKFTGNFALAIQNLADTLK